MRVDRFAEPGDIEPAELASAVFFDLGEGVDPETLVRFLGERVELPLEEAQAIVGKENGRLQDRMHWVADQLEQQRQRPPAIADTLVEQDWPAALAAAFVDRTQRELSLLAQSAAGRDQLMAKSRRGMLFGLLWFAGGAFATWISQYAVEHGFGSYLLLAWGPIIFGVVLFAHSAFRWCRHRFARTLT